MTTEPGDRLLRALPAVFAAADAQRHDLKHLLAAFEKLFFDDRGSGSLVGVERSVNALPSFFVPAEAPGSYVQWMAAWLGFTPHRHFDVDHLRRIVPDLVGLYSHRGTRVYLVKLLEVCFDEIESIEVDDRPAVGLHVGRARLGDTSRLERAAAFRFDVRARPRAGQPVTAALERRVRAVIDFAKPAHTRYEIRWADAVETPARHRRLPPSDRLSPPWSTSP